MTMLPFLQSALSSLGPMDAAEIAALCFPRHALRTVQRQLRTWVQAGQLGATVQSERCGNITVRTGMRYHHPTQRVQLPESTIAQATTRYAKQLVACCWQLPGVTGLRTITLRPNGGGRVVIFRRNPERRALPDPFTPIPWLSRTSIPVWPEGERSYLLIADSPEIPAALHYQAAQMFARRCDPLGWEQSFPIPHPVIIAATPKRRALLGATWKAGWLAATVLITTEQRLDEHGWCAPIWTCWSVRSQRTRLLFEAWLPDDKIPANNERLESQEWWHGPQRIPTTQGRAPPQRGMDTRSP